MKVNRAVRCGQPDVLTAEIVALYLTMNSLCTQGFSSLAVFCLLSQTLLVSSLALLNEGDRDGGVSIYYSKRSGFIIDNMFSVSNTSPSCCPAYCPCAV